MEGRALSSSKRNPLKPTLFFALFSPSAGFVQSLVFLYDDRIKEERYTVKISSSFIIDID